MDLSEFLLARLDEDEQAAQRAQPGPWMTVPAAMPGETEVRHQMPDARPDSAAAVATTHGLYCAGSDAGHIARHDPARVLAEVEAKRAIVELHHGMHHCPNARVANYIVGTIACPTLRLLALPYADHPDYLAEWKPNS